MRVVPDLAVIEKYGSYRALDIRDAPVIEMSVYTYVLNMNLITFNCKMEYPIQILK